MGAVLVAESPLMLGLSPTHGCGVVQASAGLASLPAMNVLASRPRLRMAGRGGCAVI